MYNRAIEIANQFLGEDVNNDNQIKQIKIKKAQLQKQYEEKKAQMTAQFNNQIKALDDQLSKLGATVIDTEDK